MNNWIDLIQRLISFRREIGYPIDDGTGQVKRDGYNGETEWVVGNEVSKM
jgi:hypothetical protein